MNIDKFGRSELGQYFYNPYATSATTGDLYVRTNGNSTIVSDIDFNSLKIINLGEPTSAHDAATKNYADKELCKQSNKELCIPQEER